jgi:hypothetical protein
VRSYNEGDAFIQDIGFYDSDFSASTPATARYRIDCLTNKREVSDWTEISSPTQAEEIVVTSSDNAIINTRNKQELRQMVVQSNYGTDTQKSETIEWTVRNLQGVS